MVISLQLTPGNRITTIQPTLEIDPATGMQAFYCVSTYNIVSMALE